MSRSVYSVNSHFSLTYAFTFSCIYIFLKGFPNIYFINKFIEHFQHIINDVINEYIKKYRIPRIYTCTRIYVCIIKINIVKLCLGIDTLIGN